MPARAPRQSTEDWFRIIGEFNQSGLSVEEFCSLRGYASSTFNRWRLRYSKRPSQAPVQTNASRPAFIEAVSRDSASVTITLGESVRMDCPLSLGIEQIARLARALATDGRV